MQDVIIIGGGVIGLAVARELSRDFRVTVLERHETGRGASHAAAGILSPQSEADAPGPFFDFCMASRDMYAEFAAELAAETQLDAEYRAAGLLYLAANAERLLVLEARARWQQAKGMAAGIIDAAEVRRLEPAATMEIAGALSIPDDPQVTPRRLMEALRLACVQRGVSLRTGFEVRRILADSRGIRGVASASETVEGDIVIVCSGVWSAAIDGLDPPIPVFPRKGQILALRMPADATFQRMLRWEHAYAVPRPDGTVIIGATNEDAGFDGSLTAGAIHTLLSEAQRLSPALAGAALVEMWTGFRPATADALPIIGASNIPGLIYATGHYRNGILLAPATAAVVTDLARGRKPVYDIAAFAPTRTGLG